MMRPLVLALIVTLPGWAAAQDQGAPPFDLAALKIPPGFLDLSELQIVGVPGGGTIATARTTLAGQASDVFLSAGPGANGKRSMTLALRPRDWSLTKAIPALANPVLDNLTLSHVTLVITDQDTRVPSMALEDDEFAFYREVYGADDFTLVLKPGINLIAAIPVDRLEAGHPLLAVMDALGIEKGTVLLQGALGSNLALLGGGGGSGGGGGLKDLYLRAELPPMRPPGSPEWFRSGQLALELTGLPSVRLVGEMNVLIKEDELQFFLAASLAASGLSLSGGMVAIEPWVAPFGIDWLTLNKVILQIGITSAGGVQLGFAGDAVFGEKDINVAVAIAITPPGVPTNFIIQGGSEAGVGLSDVAKVQAKMAAARDALTEGAAPPPLINVDALPNIEFRSLGLKFAPMAAPDLGVEQGMAIKGRMWLPTGPGGALTDFAGVDVNVSRDGFWARGDLGAFTLGPLVWQDAKLDLTAMPGDQHLVLKGDAQLFGARQKVDVSISKTKLEFHTVSELYGLFRATVDATAAFNLRSPSFQVDAVVDNSFGTYVQPLVREGVERFARASAPVVQRLSETVAAVDQVLSHSAATAAELRRVLETQRANAQLSLAAAQAAADEARASAAAAKRQQDAAHRLWSDTPARQFALKASRRVEWVRLTAVYATRTAVYSGIYAVAETQRRILAALPPVDQNALLVAAEGAVAVLRGQLQEAQRQLGTLRERVDAVLALVETGVDLFTVEHAEIHAGLDGLLRGEAVNWKLTGMFVGQPYSLERSLSFAEPARAVADVVMGVIGG